MSDDFLTPTEWITLEPQDSAVPFTFTFGVCSSATANDGFLPYGTNISSITITAYNSSGTDATTQLVSSSSEDSNVVTVSLKYPATSGAGIYKLTFKLTLDNGTIKEADFTRIRAENT
jgi:hypothetical protein